jgi:hypothetical protein
MQVHTYVSATFQCFHDSEYLYQGLTDCDAYCDTARRHNPEDLDLNLSGRFSDLNGLKQGIIYPHCFLSWPWNKILDIV